MSYSRRQALGLIGAAGAALLPLGRGARAQGRSSPACVVSPAQIEGPYFVEEQLERADIRSDPKSGAAKTGVPLRLSFVVSRVGASTCVPLPGAHARWADIEANLQTLLVVSHAPTAAARALV